MKCYAVISSDCFQTKGVSSNEMNAYTFTIILSIKPVYNPVNTK